MRVIYTLFFLIAVAVPTATSAQYLNQTEIEEMLALSGATPESAGMKQLRVCRLVGEAKIPGANANQSSVGQVASKKIYLSLQRFAAEYKVTKPQWTWRVTCTAEWQLITPGLTKLVGGERRLKEIVVVSNHGKPEAAAIGEEVRVRINGQIYVLRGENLLSWNACRPLRFGTTAPAVRKKDCQ